MTFFLKKNYLIQIVILFILFAIVSGCKDIIDQEKAFSKTVLSFKKMYVKIDKADSIKKMKRIEKNGLDEKVIFSMENRIKYVKKTQDKWLKIYYDLNNYIQNYPQEKWADDAQFLIALMFARISWSGESFEEIAIQSYKDIINKVQNIRLEEWTIQNFKGFVIFDMLVFKGNTNYPYSKLEFSDKARIYFQTLIINKYILNKNYAQADIEYENLKKYTSDPSILDPIKFNIDREKE